MPSPDGEQDGRDAPDVANLETAAHKGEPPASADDSPGASDLIDEVSKRSDAPPASMLLDGVEFSQPSRSADIIQSDRSDETYEPSADDSED